MKLKENAFSFVVGGFQIILAILFIAAVDYGEYLDISKEGDSNSPIRYYSFFQDVHVMIFIGFGFLMTFLKKYSYGAVGYNLFIAAVVLQWATLINAWLANVAGGEKQPFNVKVDLKSMITSDFAAGAVLITYGAVLGKVSRLQLFLIGVIEIIFYAINETILVHYLYITDVGGSMVIHMFGAYFGLAVTRAIYNDDHGVENSKEGSVYHSDVFAMIGTIFLWMFWPSFNGAMLGPGPQQHRALLNTYYSLAACCVTTFVISPLLNKKQKIDMVHVQNATLAGGVAVGTCADLMIKPWGAILIGITSGIISTVGYVHVTPFLLSKLRIHDTCGVNNLHGMPAIIAAIAGSIASATATFDAYGAELFSIWSARQPKLNSTLYYSAASKNIVFEKSGIGRSAGTQGAIQFAAMVVTLAVSIIGGAITGFIVKCIDTPGEEQLFDDKSYWIVPSNDEYPLQNDVIKMEEKQSLTAQESC